MTFIHSPKIVTDGLRFYLDAGNDKSYPGSGTLWGDMSGNNNNGNLVNGPTFNVNNGGSLAFDGINDYTVLPTNFFNHDAGTPFTVSVWFKTSVAGGVILGQQNTTTPGAASGYVPAIYVDTNGNIVTSCFWGGSTTNTSTSNTVVTNNAWYNLTVTFESTSHRSYLNGTLFGTITKTQTSYAGTYYYFLATGNFSGWPDADASPYFTGNISNFMFYTRALSAREVLQNFNALRSRFGI